MYQRRFNYRKKYKTGGFRAKRGRWIIDPMARDHPYNDYIKFPQVRVIDEDGTNMGVMETPKALEYARSKGLDLVIVALKAQPPVAKVVDLEHFRYELQKKEKQIRKKQKEHKPKEIKFKPLIGDGDYKRKLEQIREFLEDGYVVKVTIIKKRRVSKELQQALKDRLLTDLKMYSNIIDIQDKGANIHILVKSQAQNGPKKRENSQEEGTDKQK